MREESLCLPIHGSRRRRDRAFEHPYSGYCPAKLSQGPRKQILASDLGGREAIWVDFRHVLFLEGRDWEAIASGLGGGDGIWVTRAIHPGGRDRVWGRLVTSWTAQNVTKNPPRDFFAAKNARSTSSSRTRPASWCIRRSARSRGSRPGSPGTRSGSGRPRRRGPDPPVVTVHSTSPYSIGGDPASGRRPSRGP